MRRVGQQLGRQLRGGSCIELVGDVGTGKTTLMKGVAVALGIEDDIQSPSFTINREYPVPGGLRLCHYDFYRLAKPGVMSYELAESLADPSVITAIEWADTVEDVLPAQRIIVCLGYLPDGMGRRLQLADTSHTIDAKEVCDAAADTD